MHRERSVTVAMVGAALFVVLGTPASGPDLGSGGGTEAQAFFGPAQVLAANVRPRAAPDVYATLRNTVLVVPAPGVLLNDVDANGDPLVANLQSGSAFGTEQLASNGGFTYTPALNWVGVDTFRYCAEDPDVCSNIVTVKITVTGTPPLPTPTLPPLPTPIPTPPPLATPSPSLPLLTPIPTLPPLATPSPSLPLPTPTPPTGPSGSPSPSPSAGGPDTGGGAGPLQTGTGPAAPGGSNPGQRAEVDLVPRVRDAGPVGGSWSGLGGAAPNLEWAVPGAALAFPGLLVLIVGAMQTVGGAAWLPIVRRALRGTGVARAERRYRYIVRTTE